MTLEMVASFLGRLYKRQAEATPQNFLTYILMLLSPKISSSFVSSVYSFRIMSRRRGDSGSVLQEGWNAVSKKLLKLAETKDIDSLRG